MISGAIIADVEKYLKRCLQHGTLNLNLLDKIEDKIAEDHNSSSFAELGYGRFLQFILQEAKEVKVISYFRFHLYLLQIYPTQDIFLKLTCSPFAGFVRSHMVNNKIVSCQISLSLVNNHFKSSESTEIDYFCMKFSHNISC